MKTFEKKAPRVLAVIPARGGSKRLPRKNIMQIAGHPMISYSILAASESKNITDYVVSSDDDEIIEISRKYGANIEFKRPVELATDSVRNIDVSLHALNFLEGKSGRQYDMIVLLQPTSPIRSSAHIDEAIISLWESDLDSLASVKGPFSKRDPILKRINSKGELVSYVASNSQQEDPFYIYNASIYAVKREYFMRERRFVSDRQIPYKMDKFHSVDVDEYEDLLVAEAYLQQRKCK